MNAEGNECHVQLSIKLLLLLFLLLLQLDNESKRKILKLNNDHDAIFL